MKPIPNNTIRELCRYIPMLLENIDPDTIRKSLRLSNAVRVTKYQILPKLERINNSKAQPNQ